METAIQTINIHQAKTHLSRLVEDVALSGQPIIIAKAGKPRVQIVPLEEPQPVRKMGTLKDKYPSVSLAEFNQLDEEVSLLFAGESA